MVWLPFPSQFYLTTDVKVQSPHSWSVPPAEARQIQQQLRKRVRLRNELPALRYVAGVDISVKNDLARAVGMYLGAAQVQWEPIVPDE